MEAKFPRPEGEEEPGKPGTFFSGCNKTGTQLPRGSASAASPGGSSALPAAGRSRIRSAQPRKRFLPSCPPPLPLQPPFSVYQSSRSLPFSYIGAGKRRPPAPPPPRSQAEVTGGVPRVGFRKVNTRDGSYCAAHGNGTAFSVPMALTPMALPCSVPMLLTPVALPFCVPMALPLMALTCPDPTALPALSPMALTSMALPALSHQWL